MYWVVLLIYYNKTAVVDFPDCTIHFIIFYMFGHDLAYSVPEPLFDLAFGLSLNNLYKISHVSESLYIIFPIALTVYSFIWDMFSMFLCIHVLSLFGPLRTEPVVGHLKILPCYSVDIFILNDSSHHAHTGKITLTFIDRILFMLLIVYSFGLPSP